MLFSLIKERLPIGAYRFADSQARSDYNLRYYVCIHAECVSLKRKHHFDSLVCAGRTRHIPTGFP